MGAVVGRLGPVVGYRWKGRPVFRAYVQHIRYPNTERQQAERDWFVGMVRFASAAREALVEGLRQASLREGMTEGNYFVMKNKRHFHATADGGVRRVEVDYGQLSLSEGCVAPVTPTRVAADADGTLHVGWRRHAGQMRERSTDRVRCYVYNADMRQGLLSAPAPRAMAALAMRLPDGWCGHELHCYLFAVDGQGHASPTRHACPATDGDDAVEAFTVDAADALQLKKICSDCEKVVFLQRETPVVHTGTAVPPAGDTRAG